MKTKMFKVSRYIQCLILFFTIAALASLLQSCNRGPKYNLSILASEELKVMEPFLKEMEEKTKVSISLRYADMREVAERVARGEQVDAIWLPSDAYLKLVPEAKSRAWSTTSTMLSPLILGVRRSKASSWGLSSNVSITWLDLANKAASGDFKFAMPNPASSFAGLGTALAVNAALGADSGKKKNNTVAQQILPNFFAGLSLTSGDYVWLTDAYISSPNKFDGIFTYESEIMRINNSLPEAERLMPIAPVDGVFFADYPISLLNSNKEREYRYILDYLRSEDVQSAISNSTFNRPVNRQATSQSAFISITNTINPFPRKMRQLESFVDAYLTQYKPSSHIVFLLDMSRSMSGERFTQVKNSLLALTEKNDKNGNPLWSLHKGERISFIPYNEEVWESKTYKVNDGSNLSLELTEIPKYLNTLNPNGATAMYDALSEAYLRIGRWMVDDASIQNYSVVVFCDGPSTRGKSLAEWESFVASLPREVGKVKTFVIFFGEADPAQMKRIAAVTGGRAFQADASSLASVVKLVRSYM